MKKRLDVGNVILLALEKTLDGYVQIEDLTMNKPHIYGGYDRPLKKSSIAKAIKRLREKGLIDFVSDEKLAIKLTRSGYEEALWAILQDENSKWDGKWRLVIFDIPEKRRQVREIFRYRLKQLGFIMWQQSVWVSKRNYTEPLRKYIRQSGIERWAMVVETDNIN